MSLERKLGPRFRGGDFFRFLARQLGAVLELLERLRVGERLDVLHLAPVHHVAYRQLDNLAALGAWNVGDLEDLRRHVARGGVVADAALDAIRDFVVHAEAVTQLDEEHDAHVALPVLADDERLDHLLELLDLAVDLRRADPDAARVEHGVRPAVDDDAVVLGDLGPVAVAPDVRVLLEIRSAVPRAVGIVPEADRHRGERPRADQLALFSLQRAPLLVEHIDRHAESLRLDLAAPDRTGRIAEHEARRCRCRPRWTRGRRRASRSCRRSRSL